MCALCGPKLVSFLLVAGSTRSSQSLNDRSSNPDVTPPGCAYDAYKLFVGNIPRHFDEIQLLPLFTAHGQVVELVVTRDKSTMVSDHDVGVGCCA